MNNEAEAVEEQVDKNESAIAGDDRIVRVIIKIRDAMAAKAAAHDAEMDVLEKQKHKLEVELMRRLHERGATQTKTEFGTAFLGESMKVTIADQDAFRGFCLKERDLDFFQSRVKLEHLREYMKAHDGMTPPGLSLFREVTLNVRTPTKKGAKSDAAADS